MAVALSRGRSEQLPLQKFKEKQEDYTNNMNLNNQQKNAGVVPVVYYLSRNGQLEHPHFMEVPLSSSHGLFLSDVINRLYLLRGKSMPSRYSWSSKRSYKSGYVWHDLAENDFIQPVHGGEYVLKGSEIMVENVISSPTASKSSETTSSSSSAKNTPAAGDSDFPAVRNRRRNQSWGAIDLHEYKVYKTESTHEFAGKAAANASTQTEEKRRRRKAVVIKEEPEKEKIEEVQHQEEQQQQSTELSREDFSPPLSDSSPETLETLMKVDGRLLLGSSSSTSTSTTTNSSHALNNQIDQNQTIGSCASGRMKASTVLMSLISCGSISFKDCGVKDNNGFSLVSHYKTRVPRGTQNQDHSLDVEDGTNDMMMVEMENNVSSKFAKMALEDKEYFSGSLIETQKQEFPTMLKRSSSYNADRSVHMKLEEKEVEGVRAKCIPRKPKTQSSASKKECNTDSTRATLNNTHQERNQN